jgi:hypothetical protein
MKIDETGIRSLVSASLLSLLVAVAIYLWFVDFLTMQREFGSLLGAELVALSMLVYVYLKPSYGKFRKAWFLAGCLFLMLLMLLAIT